MDNLNEILNKIITTEKFLEDEESNLNITNDILQNSELLTNIYNDLYERNWMYILNLNNTLVKIFPQLSNSERKEIWKIMAECPAYCDAMNAIYDRDSEIDYESQYKIGLLKIIITNPLNIDNARMDLLGYIEDAKEHKLNYAPIFKELSQYADDRIYGQLISLQELFLIYAGEKHDPYDDYSPLN